MTYGRKKFYKSSPRTKYFLTTVISSIAWKAWVFCNFQPLPT